MNQWIKRAMSTAAVVAGVATSGCENGKATGPKTKEAEKAVVGAAKATAEAATEQRDAFVKLAETQLAELDKKYDELKDKAAAESAGARKTLEPKLAALKVKREAAAEKLKEVQKASGNAWESLKDGFTSAYGDLKKAFD